MEPRIVKRERKLQLAYDLPHRIHCARIYPAQCANGSTLVLYGHDQGIRVLYRGGRRPKHSDSSRTEYEDEEDEDDGTADEYEYVDDSSGLEAPAESDLQIADSMAASRRRRYDPAKAAAISARKYKFRKRMLAFMTLVMMASAAVR